ncbi:EG45-like domain containing protein [Phalaenopsis equestris]|uniref:EG45-like domain containing protein n=1 Tax=Phalaenopsis equestris TaxID=78828 RepID=UPI0009E61338|nr:EG45-like domain containing protein [Phalaenopsis equestris]
MMHPPLILLLLLLPSLFLLPFSAADVGTAASYTPPYLPTACYGDNRSPLPADAAFAAAGTGIWDNGASCGRRYVVRCLSSSTPAACISDATVVVTVVDEADGLGSRQSTERTSMALSLAAYEQIATLNAPAINIEFAML